MTAVPNNPLVVPNNPPINPPVGPINPPVVPTNTLVVPTNPLPVVQPVYITPEEAAEHVPIPEEEPVRKWYQRWIIYPYFICFLINAGSCVSLPYLAGTNLFIVQTNFPNPINGALNGISVLNLTNVRVSLARNY